MYHRKQNAYHLFAGVAVVIFWLTLHAFAVDVNPIFNPAEANDANYPVVPSSAASELIVRSGGGQTTPAPVIPSEISTLSNVTVPPAWAALPVAPSSVSSLAPFASNLFQGTFATTRPDHLGADYLITPGDQVTIRIWGTQTYNETQVVDRQGNIFLPDVGPITIEGVRHDQLNNLVKRMVAEHFPSGVNIYTNLMAAQPLAVYVSGFVTRPGRYAGGASDTILSFIDRAGGIVSQRGSYRLIKVVRGGEVVAVIDLYDFVTKGILPSLRLEENDVILVEERGPSVAVLGNLRQSARYEYPPPTDRHLNVTSFSGHFLGSDLMEMASPMENVTHVAISGSRNGIPFTSYMPRNDFMLFMLSDNDVIEFMADGQSNQIVILADGEIVGNSRFPVRKGTTLRSFLEHVAVNPATADITSVYLRRRSVAEQQKKSIDDSLNRLEKMALTASSSTPAEASVRAQEAQMIQNFVARARRIQPDGVIVVTSSGQVIDIILEDGDVVVVPPLRQTVQVSGEVHVPKVVACRQGARLGDYINMAGGYSRRADKRNLLVVHPNGEVVQGGKNIPILPGDHIMVLPRYESKRMIFFKDMTQILYQIAIATKVVNDL